MSIGKNIKLLRERKGMTQEELGKAVGVSSMAVSQWENNRAVPRIGSIERLSEALGVSKSELISDDDLSSRPSNAIPITGSKPAYLPLLGRVHAGDAQEPDVIDAQIPVPYEVWERHQDGYLLEVEGTCMSKVYPEGCHILVDPTKPPMNGSIAVVKLNDDDYVMRRMYKGANTLVLSPESWDEGYTDIVITQSDEMTVELVGTVVWYQPKEEME